jgi:hypothetical protein
VLLLLLEGQAAIDDETQPRGAPDDRPHQLGAQGARVRSFVTSLPLAKDPAAQILRDLDALNKAGALTDGSVPLAVWLENAALLARPRREAVDFKEALARLGGAERG